MATEIDIYNALVAAAAPVPVYRIHAPQLTDEQPIATPFVVFERSVSADFESQSYCGSAGFNADYLVDCIDKDYAGARQLLVSLQTALKGFSLEFEYIYEDRDRTTRAYICSGSFTNWERDALAIQP